MVAGRAAVPLARRRAACRRRSARRAVHGHAHVPLGGHDAGANPAPQTEPAAVGASTRTLDLVAEAGVVGDLVPDVGSACRALLHPAAGGSKSSAGPALLSSGTPKRRAQFSGRSSSA